MCTLASHSLRVVPTPSIVPLPLSLNAKSLGENDLYA
jgi:hypothetical protein